ncbi:3-keto-disaccharide hydrolase [Wenyingzhuangia sp. IMCC45574]
MKRILHLIMMFVFCLITSCSEEKKEVVQTKKEKTVKKNLLNPFIKLDLKDLSTFKPTGANWKIVGDVVVDRNKKKTINSEAGSGILLNTNDQKSNKNLVTAFDHKDIELELDVMVPVRSNSGIYFQSRYEVQIFDSWNVKKLRPKDMGAIYERWDKNAPKGKQGYEGHPPRINAAKAPGLWQHLKVIFHAPRFDAKGNKIKNAWFEEVWLNGVLVQQNVEVTGPTRSRFEDEKPRAPLLIQGDHGPVAFKNIQYRLFNGKRIKLTNLIRKEYSAQETVKNIHQQKPLKEESTQTFSLIDVATQKAKKTVAYSGTLNVSEAGNYLFEIRPGKGTVELHIDGQKPYKLKTSQAYRNKSFKLKKGTTNFKLIYNHTRPRVKWLNNFGFLIEAPKMQKYTIQDGVDKNVDKFDPLKGIIIEPENGIRTQRSFVTHNGIARTHCISVGSPDGTHYSYDLATGSLLKVWDGSFLNTTHMWLTRGLKQLGAPIGFNIEMHGDLEFASLENEHAAWPSPDPENKGLQQLGYEFNEKRIPTFSYKIGNTTISNTFLTNKNKREIKKVINVNADKEIWHKLANGKDIKELSNHTYIVNNESYYIDFSGNTSFNPIIRTNNGKQELLVKVPVGVNKIVYKIIW